MKIFRFQSTLPRGERRNQVCGRVGKVCDFNPRSREGSDPIRSSNRDKSIQISIHAPARGATPYYLHKWISFYHFNPRSREGSDRTMLLQLLVRSGFQSTLPRGERRSCCTFYLNYNQISIHAPARGATYCSDLTELFTSISIHAPARGATLIFRHPYLQYLNFNPRSREGSDAIV